MGNSRIAAIICNRGGDRGRGGAQAHEDRSEYEMEIKNSPLPWSLSATNMFPTPSRVPESEQILQARSHMGLHGSMGPYETGTPGF